MDLKQFVSTTIHQRYKNVICCFFYGSNARQEAHANSDIDVITVVGDEIPPFREHFSVSGKLFDSFVFDAGSLHAAMRQSFSTGSFTLVHSIQDAIPLPFATPISIKLKEIASDIQRTSSVNIERAFFMARHRLGSVVNDLNHCEERDRIAVVNGAYRVVCEALLLCYGGGMQGVKHGGRYLQKSMADDYAHLQDALRNAIAGDIQQMRKWAQSTLDKIGGPLGNSFRERLPILPRIPLE